jgi:hypothetical protein
MSAIDDAISERFLAAFEATQRQCVDIAREMLSVPVTYSTGPRGGQIATRSVRGEMPRMEFGHLHTDTQSSVGMENGSPVMYIFWTLDYAGYLNDPETFDRPILDLLSQRLQSDLPGLLAENLR